MGKKCDRCHGEVDAGIPLLAVTHHRKGFDLYLCATCARFIRDRFDDVIDEYILREE